MPSLPPAPAAVALARMINAYANTWDAVAAAVGVAGTNSRPPDEQIHVAHDQRLRALEIAGFRALGRAPS
jgi:hypothetical protein